MSALGIPANANELYEMLIQTPDLCGQFTLVHEQELRWDIYKDFAVSIGIGKMDACILIERKILGKLPDILTHWHSEPSDIYDEICDIGSRGNVLVIRKNFLGEAILYTGPETDCPYSPDIKWHWGKIYYLKAG